MSLFASLRFWVIFIFPAGWIFGTAIQHQWIQQRCGTPSLLAQNARVCADNTLRMWLGGPVTCLVLLVIFALLYLPFYFNLKEERRKIASKIIISYQALGLSAIVFLPVFCREQTIVLIGMLFLLVLIFLLRPYFSPLFQNLFPVASEGTPEFKSEDRFFRILFYGALAFHLIFIFVGFNHSITEHHSFRQTQTALSVYWMVQDGFKIWYETPMFGAPWSVPMEFPVYQYICAFIVRLTGIELQWVGRMISIVSFYALLLLLARFFKEVKLPLNTRLLILSLILLTPLHIFYSRAVLIEIFTLFIGVAWIWASYHFLRTRHVLWLLPAVLLGMTCSLSKITTFVVFGFFQLGVFWITLKKPLKSNLTLSNILFYLFAGLFLVFVPLAIGIFWVRESDLVKALNPMIGDHWNSKALQEWNFGTLSLRLSFTYWRSIFLSNLNNILGYFGIPILAVLLWRTVRRFSPENVFVVFAITTFFFGPLLFSNLYYIHDYYYVSCAIFLTLAIGVKIGAFYESGSGVARRNIQRYLVLPLIGSMVLGYFGEYFKKQLDGGVHPARRIADVVRSRTQMRDVVIAHGYAAPELPYFVQRKTLVEAIDDVRHDNKRFLAALRQLKSEKVGAVLIPAAWSVSEKKNLLDLYVREIAFQGTQINSVEGYEVYIGR